MKQTAVYEDGPTHEKRIRVLETRVGFLTSELGREIFLRRGLWFCIFLYLCHRWIYG